MTAARLKILPQGITLTAECGQSLLSVLRENALAPDAVCGGNGKCGKCAVTVNGRRVLACEAEVQGDMTVVLDTVDAEVLAAADFSADGTDGVYALAYDIGTTSVVCCLISPEGALLSDEGRLNPQAGYGADVVTRIQSACAGTLAAQSKLIRDCLCDMALTVCEKAGVMPSDVCTVSVVGNPAMQQIFLGADTKNLIEIPFAPLITSALTMTAKEYIPVCENAALRVVPDASGYVGGDTAACVLSCKMHEDECLCLLVDIGTNGELVLGNKDRLYCCSAAAGPALEGAQITLGMRSSVGAIKSVKALDGGFDCRTIDGAEPVGICGSGLIDALAACLELGLINNRGRIKNGDRIYLCDTVYITQEDIRQLQLAKGAISAGIILLAKAAGVELCDIDRVYLAGAFGSALNPESACRTGLIPTELRGKIIPVGNAAGAGACLAAVSEALFGETDAIVKSMEPVELADLPDFSRVFASQMYFKE